VFRARPPSPSRTPKRPLSSLLRAEVPSIRSQGRAGERDEGRNKESRACSESSTRRRGSEQLLPSSRDDDKKREGDASRLGVLTGWSEGDRRVREVESAFRGREEARTRRIRACSRGRLNPIHFSSSLGHSNIASLLREPKCVILLS